MVQRSVFIERGSISAGVVRAAEGWLESVGVDEGW